MANKFHTLFLLSVCSLAGLMGLSHFLLVVYDFKIVLISAKYSQRYKMLLRKDNTKIKVIKRTIFSKIKPVLLSIPL